MLHISKHRKINNFFIAANLYLWPETDLLENGGGGHLPVEGVEVDSGRITGAEQLPAHNKHNFCYFVVLYMYVLSFFLNFESLERDCSYKHICTHGILLV